MVRIACGNLHNVALTEEGDVYSWGWGIQGALGHGNRNFQHVPRVLAKLRGERLVLLVAGAHSNFVGTSGSSATFAFDFKGLLNKASYSDLTFKVQGKLIQAHQAIVFTRCLRFKQLAIVWWMQHPTSDPVEVDGVEYFVFLSLLKVRQLLPLSLSPLKLLVPLHGPPPSHPSSRPQAPSDGSEVSTPTPRGTLSSFPPD